MKWFKSLSPMWQLIVVFIVLLVIYFLYRKYSTDVRNLFQPRDITPSNIVLPDGSVVTVSTTADLPQSVKSSLEGLAGEIKTDIYGANLTHEMELYKKASALSDVEIDYLASYYKRNLTNGVSLYEDMNNELVSCYVQDCSGWTLLLTKLEKTGNR